MDSFDKPVGKPKIAISLEYRCFPVWFYDENNELIENDLPEDIKDNSQINSLCDDIQRTYDSLYIDNDIEFSYRGFESEADRESFAKKLTELKTLLREVAGDKYEIVSDDSLKGNSDENDGRIKIQVDLRDKEWRKGLIVTSIMFILAVLILAGGIYTKTIAAIVIGGIGTALFGFGTFLGANPNQHVSMQMVKGEMSYRQLQDAIAKEKFEKPIQLLYGAGKPTLFLVSENWVVLGDKIGTPVYIPKNKVKFIEVRNDTLEVADHESYDGQAYQAPYCYLRFKCDEKHIFECGLIKPKNMMRVLKELRRYFPFSDAEVRTIGKDE